MAENPQVQAQPLPHNFLPEMRAELDSFLHSNRIGILRNLLRQLEQDLHTKRLNIVLGLLACLALYLVIGQSAHFLCDFIGFIYPAYVFVSSIEKNRGQGSQNAQNQQPLNSAKWITYWVIYSAFNFVEYLCERTFPIGLPFYWLVKCYILVVCYLPVSWNGSEKMYRKYVRPFLQRHQQSIDAELNAAINNNRGFILFSIAMSAMFWGHQFNCNVAGFLYPAYLSLKAVESANRDQETTRWLTYWMIYSLVSLFEFVHDVIWIPLYWPLKFIILMTCIGPVGLKLSYNVLSKFILLRQPVRAVHKFFSRVIHYFLVFRASAYGVNGAPTDRFDRVRPNPVITVPTAPENESGTSGSENTVRKANRKVDPVEIRWEMSTPMVKAVLAMDVEERLVKKAVIQKMAKDGENYVNAGDLLDAVFSLEDKSCVDEEETESSVAAREVMRDRLDISAPSADSPDTDDAVKVIEENRRLKEQKLCKVCMEDEVEVVFVPCGHFVCCFVCTLDLSVCPICRSEIENCVRTYMS